MKLLALTLFAFVSAVSAITNEELDAMTHQELSAYFKLPLKADRLTGWSSQESKVNAEELGPYYQGDILLQEEKEEAVSRNGVIDPDLFWPGGFVPYVVHRESFDAEALESIDAALLEYTELTDGCINWIPRTDEEDFVFITGIFDGCSSYVGKIGGAQTISYEDGCTDRYGTTQHEMYHALGFHHEQSRTDRDDYVKIMEENIEEGRENNFRKYEEDEVSPYGEDYDYGSAMHYSAFAFSANDRPTIVPYNPVGSEIGQREHLSEVDVSKLMNMYECPQ